MPRHCPAGFRGLYFQHFRCPRHRSSKPRIRSAWRYSAALRPFSSSARQWSGVESAVRAGLPKVRFHDLRHTFATLALQNGVDIKTVSGMLGHFSAGFTLDTYAHVTTSAKREAAKTMGNILSGAV